MKMMPFDEVYENVKPGSDDSCVKDGLSERKPLFDGWGDSRVSRTPRSIPIKSHKEESHD